MRITYVFIASLYACAAWSSLSGPPLMADILEVESNDSKATATVGSLLTGQKIIGNSTGSSTTTAGSASADYFRISIGGLSPGIYRHRLVITTAGTAGHTGTIRGLNQSGGVIGTLDNTVQTSSTTTTPPRYNQFYGFGDPSAEMFYRVTGTASTTADYNATLETLQITPTFIGDYLPGSITITTAGQGHTTDTDLWVYDSAFNAIAGYGVDDSGSAQATLTQNYTPGTYYLALTNFNFANHLPSLASSGNTFLSGTVMDFPGFAANSSTTIGLNMAFNISDGSTSLNVANTKASQFDINWFQFTVTAAIPEPSCVSIVGLSMIAGVCLKRRRR